MTITLNYLNMSVGNYFLKIQAQVNYQIMGGFLNPIKEGVKTIV